MIDKVAATVAQALGDVADGATVLVGGFRHRRHSQ